MSDFPSIKTVILSALLAAGSACTCSDGLVEYEYTLAVADKKFTALIQSCLEDDLSCSSLCEALLIEEGENDVSVVECRLSLNESGNRATVEATYQFPIECFAGRRPSGDLTCVHPRIDPISDWLATMTVLEASAVFAFVELARNLLHNGAPHSLVKRCLAAADDEVRHTSCMRELARARGVDPMLPQWSEEDPLSLFALAMLNATEGCVRETYGAALALWQSQHCTDAKMGAVMLAIARDEIEHAQLSADIGEWIELRLSDNQIKAINLAKRASIAELRAAVQAKDEDRLLGIPSGSQAARLIDALFT